MNTRNPTSSLPTGYLSNGSKQRYLLEADSTTGFVAWQMDNGTILVSAARQVSIKPCACIRFWSCAGCMDTTAGGSITSFDCHGNALTQLDVIALTQLEYLDCCHNRLQSLNLSGLTELQAVDADCNCLVRLEVRQLSALRVLNCATNRLTRLDVSGLKALQVLDASRNPMKFFKQSGCAVLKDCRLPRGLAARPQTRRNP